VVALDDTERRIFLCGSFAPPPQQGARRRCAAAESFQTDNGVGPICISGANDQEPRFPCQTWLPDSSPALMFVAADWHFNFDIVSPRLALAHAVRTPRTLRWTRKITMAGRGPAVMSKQRPRAIG